MHWILVDAEEADNCSVNQNVRTGFPDAGGPVMRVPCKDQDSYLPVVLAAPPLLNCGARSFIIFSKRLR